MSWIIAINSVTGPLFPREGRKVSLLNLHESGWILADPEKYFTDEVMEKLDEIAKKEFSYGA